MSGLSVFRIWEWGTSLLRKPPVIVAIVGALVTVASSFAVAYMSEQAVRESVLPPFYVQPRIPYDRSLVGPGYYGQPDLYRPLTFLRVEPEELHLVTPPPVIYTFIGRPRSGP